jgi:hypothetical protein
MHGTTRLGRSLALATALLLAACGGIDRRAVTAPAGSGASPTRPSELTSAAPLQPPVATSPVASDRPLYTCITEVRGERKQTAIEMEPKVASLCARHPEMGPCQYERDLCRKAGGRVFAQNGQEITRRTEDEYDRKVMRVRFRAN